MSVHQITPSLFYETQIFNPPHTHTYTAGQLLLQCVPESTGDGAGGAVRRCHLSYDPHPIKERQTCAPINSSPFQKCLCFLSNNSWEQLTARTQQFGLPGGALCSLNYTQKRGLKSINYLFFAWIFVHVFALCVNYKTGRVCLFKNCNSISS